MPDRATWLAALGFILIGGVNFVAVGFSNKELPPFLGAGVRFGAAALVFLAISALVRAPRPRGRGVLGIAAYGVLAIGVSYAFAYWALTELPAGVAAVLFASTPLFTAILAPLHGVERFRLRGLVGSGIALAGIAVLANAGAGDHLPFLSVAAMLCSAAASAEAGVLLKFFPRVHPAPTNGFAMAIGSLLLLTLSLAGGERWAVPTLPRTWLAVGYLALIGSVALFGLFLFVLTRWTATSTSYMATMIPVVAMLAGSVLASQPLTLRGIIGGAIVLAGVYVGVLSGTGLRWGGGMPEAAAATGPSRAPTGQTGTVP